MALRIVRSNNDENTGDLFSALNPMLSGRDRIGDVLIARGLISQKNLELALSEARATQMPVGAVLINREMIDEAELGKALADMHGLRYFPMADFQPDLDVLHALPDYYIKTNLVIPVSVDQENKRMKVAMAHPDDHAVLDEIAMLTGFRALPMVSTYREMSDFIEKHCSTFTDSHIHDDQAVTRMAEEWASQSAADETTSSAIAQEISSDAAPVVQLVNGILIEAIKRGASDIHLDPQKNRLLVRFRVDGILHDIKSIPPNLAGPIVNRIKVASGMDIAEKRLPQDGRMRLKLGGQEVNIRINTILAQFGEKVVIRVLKSTGSSGGLEKLGMSTKEVARLSRMIRAPHGIVLVTGPTGSGKTTTLYSCLQEINSPERNLITIEDPIEYTLQGINQIQVSHKSGLNFATALRAILRQDPDVIMVGEIRDKETLEVAIQAAMTGHLVFSTIHTNSTVKTISRLMEMGAPSYMISSAVQGVVAQRLIRCICSKCKEPYKATPEDLAALGMKPNEDLTLYRGAGCDRCAKTGYEGRVGLYETLLMSERLEELINGHASATEIQAAAVEEGMQSLTQDGRQKLLSGIVTLSELQRVLGAQI